MRAQAQGEGPKAKWAQGYLHFLSNNCSCQSFFLLLSWVLFATVVSVSSSYLSFLAASIAVNILQLTESAECNELKDEKARMHNVHPSCLNLQR